VNGKMESLTKLLQADRRLVFRVDETLGVVRYLKGNLGKVGRPGSKEVQAAVLQFLKARPDLFGPADPKQLKLLSEIADPKNVQGRAGGGTSLIFQQSHGSVAVYGGTVRFHVTGEGILDTVACELFPDLGEVPTKPKIGSKEAVAIVQKELGASEGPPQPPTIVIYRHKQKPRLAWRVSIRGDKPGHHGALPEWIAYVDAGTGELFFHYDNFQTAGPVVGAGTGHYSGAGSVNAWYDDTTYQLRDTTRTATGGPEIRTDDDKGTQPSSDADNTWDVTATTPTRDVCQGAEVDAHRYVSGVIDYYSTVHGRNSYDGLGATALARVHVGTNWCNGGWSPMNQRVNLGDGNGTTWDYCCDHDWLAHEFTHAYTEHTCALQYYGESGALNESLSDLCAALINSDWLIFEDSWLQVTAPACRNMIDPTNGGNWDNSSEAAAQASVMAGHQPSHYNNRYTGTWDYSGVHINSGIINNMFYLLTVGGTHLTSGVVVTAIGQSAVEQLVWRCMTVNLVGNPTCTFSQFREAMLDACLDLFPTDLAKLTQVKNAFNAVGIGPDVYLRDNLADTGLEPYPGSYLYASPDVINRQTASADPTTEFADMGSDSLWQNVKAGQPNYVYVRIQNRGNQTGDTTLNVYFIPATSFATPASWIPVGSLPVTGIAPGTVRIAGPITFPSALIPVPGHYCMIGVLSSSLDPAPDTGLIATVPAYIDFVRNTNNIAYRNMDVEPAGGAGTAGGTGAIEVDVRGLPGQLQHYELRLDFGKFVPGAKIVIKAPAGALAGAIPRGLKLVARDKTQDIYEVLRGPAAAQQRSFYGQPELPAEPVKALAIGFDGVHAEKPFPLKVEWVLPKDFLAGAKYVPPGGYVLAVRQSWRGQSVGAFGIKLVPGKMG